ncbi:MAG: succinate dehydrogenase, cytochrome b556 subunit [bacterium]
MALSILHRISGVVLSVGLLLTTFWIYASVFDPKAYTQFMQLFDWLIVKVMLLAFVAALYYHLANGIRHLFWDAGKGFENPQITRSGVSVLIFTLLSTILFAVFIF